LLLRRLWITLDGMKFALLGVDVESLRLAEAAIAAGHEIAVTADMSTPPPVAAWAGAAISEDARAWEALLDPESADAIIIGHGACHEEARARQIQELARLGRPMLVTFPLFNSVLTYFEVDMIRTESEALLAHYNPLAEPAVLEEAASWVQKGHPELGPVEQINGARRLRDRSRERVLWHFARDVEMLDRIAGRLDRLGAHAGAEGDAAYAALSVQLVGSSQIPIRWAVEPPTRDEGLIVTLVCQRGRVTLDFDAEGRLSEPSPQVARQLGEGVDEVDPEQSVIKVFTAMVEAGDSAASSWPDALHAMELADSIEISLRRGRMIDVHHQQLTEHLAFKGTMAAVGCGVILVLVPLMLLAGLIAGQFGVPIARFLPHALLALLAVFLGLQFLPKLLYREPVAKE
jgi:hypothetical protein